MPVHEEGTANECVRFAVRGIARLADSAGDAAMALGERLTSLKRT